MPLPYDSIGSLGKSNPINLEGARAFNQRKLYLLRLNSRVISIAYSI